MKVNVDYKVGLNLALKTLGKLRNLCKLTKKDLSNNVFKKGTQIRREKELDRLRKISQSKSNNKKKLQHKIKISAEKRVF